MALGSQLFAARDPAFAELLRRKALAAYRLGVQYPGACQTAPGTAPYFYEEDNWVDDMELGAAELARPHLPAALPGGGGDVCAPGAGDAVDGGGHGAALPVVPVAQQRALRDLAAGRCGGSGSAWWTYYREGLSRVAARADNGFRMGVPFIWCSNNLVASFATQAYLYRRMSGDESYREYEQAALDWLFGANPWGVSMIVGFPAGARVPLNPHSVVAHELGVQAMKGGMIDGPVYASIYHSLGGIRLVEPDEYAPFNTGSVVYHDDFGDYSTDEPIMDGTANLTYLLAALAK